MIGRWRNRRYARRCIRDSLLRGEAPIASHLLYTQSGILNDADAAERKWGIDAGLAWLQAAEASVVYVDRGFSPGMRFGVARARALDLPVEFRTITPVRTLKQDPDAKGPDRSRGLWPWERR